MIDEEFRMFACSDEGINQFIRTFLYTVKGETKLGLLDVYHNVDDLPAIINTAGKYWYCMGKIHRSYDLPAIIYSAGWQEWFYNGKHHRENDLPAVIYQNDKDWYYHGKDTGKMIYQQLFLTMKNTGIIMVYYTEKIIYQQ